MPSLALAGIVGGVFGGAGGGIAGFEMGHFQPAATTTQTAAPLAPEVEIFNYGGQFPSSFQYSDPTGGEQISVEKRAQIKILTDKINDTDSKDKIKELLHVIYEMMEATTNTPNTNR